MFVVSLITLVSSTWHATGCAGSYLLKKLVAVSRSEGLSCMYKHMQPCCIIMKLCGIHYVDE